MKRIFLGPTNSTLLMIGPEIVKDLFVFVPFNSRIFYAHESLVHIILTRCQLDP